MIESPTAEKIEVLTLLCSLAGGLSTLYAEGHVDQAAFLAAALAAAPEIAEMGNWTPADVEHVWYRWQPTPPDHEFCMIAVRVAEGKRGACPVTALVVD